MATLPHQGAMRGTLYNLSRYVAKTKPQSCLNADSVKSQSPRKNHLKFQMAKNTLNFMEVKCNSPPTQWMDGWLDNWKYLV